MADIVELVLEDARWGEAGLGRLAERAARAALGGAGLGEAGYEVSVLACDDARIAELNAAFRGKAAATNVLSWPAFELGPVQPGGPPRPPPAPGAAEREAGTVFLGDIALAFETCAREAAARDLPLADHAAHLVAHGVLHLLGHDHEDPAGAARMEALETKILVRMGVVDPYSS